MRTRASSTGNTADRRLCPSTRRNEPNEISASSISRPKARSSWSIRERALEGGVPFLPCPRKRTSAVVGRCRSEDFGRTERRAFESACRDPLHHHSKEEPMSRLMTILIHLHPLVVNAEQVDAADDALSFVQAFVDARNSGDIAAAAPLMADDTVFVGGPGCTAANPCVGAEAHLA